MEILYVPVPFSSHKISYYYLTVSPCRVPLYDSCIMFASGEGGVPHEAEGTAVVVVVVVVIMVVVVIIVVVVAMQFGKMDWTI